MQKSYAKSAALLDPRKRGTLSRIESAHSHSCSRPVGAAGASQHLWLRARNIERPTDDRCLYPVIADRVIASATLRSSAAGPISTQPTTIGFAAEEPCLAAEVLDRRR
jgi:hypothetical protein